MDPIKRKVLSDLFLAPSVVLPIVGGISAALLSWAGGGVSSLSLAAVAGILGGFGWMMTRMIYRLEDITADAMKFQQEQLAAKEKKALDLLQFQLRIDRDHRTQDYLTLLRSLCNEFVESSSRPDVLMRSGEVRTQIQLVFAAAVDQLRETLKLWELSQSLVGDQRKKVLAERERLLSEIAVTIDQMRSAVSYFKEVSRQGNQVDLASLRDELETSIRVAQRTEERLREFDPNKPSYDPDSFSRE